MFSVKTSYLNYIMTNAARMFATSSRPMFTQVGQTLPARLTKGGLPGKGGRRQGQNQIVSLTTYISALEFGPLEGFQHIRRLVWHTGSQKMAHLLARRGMSLGCPPMQYGQARCDGLPQRL